jgi:hypothetical protein
MGIYKSLIENINVGIETEAAGRAQFLFWEYLFQIIGIVSFGVYNGTCIVQAASIDIYYSEDRS